MSDMFWLILRFLVSESMAVTKDLVEMSWWDKKRPHFDWVLALLTRKADVNEAWCAFLAYDMTDGKTWVPWNGVARVLVCIRLTKPRWSGLAVLSRPESRQSPRKHPD